ncbi:hypothetical protein V8G54_004376 [Vigna mungo]|uniref:Uncharacterized protein n=1 Tax=Vigna mungo TaxID=3915 RepID=A0AAQ3SCT5_VIGMU
MSILPNRYSALDWKPEPDNWSRESMRKLLPSIFRPSCSPQVMEINDSKETDTSSDRPAMELKLSYMSHVWPVDFCEIRAIGIVREKIESLSHLTYIANTLIVYRSFYVGFGHAFPEIVFVGITKNVIRRCAYGSFCFVFGSCRCVGVQLSVLLSGTLPLGVQLSALLSRSGGDNDVANLIYLRLKGEGIWIFFATHTCFLSIGALGGKLGVVGTVLLHHWVFFLLPFPPFL